jgi:tetratricopeptide (TPR) repeat protein
VGGGSSGFTKYNYRLRMKPAATAAKLMLLVFAVSLVLETAPARQTAQPPSDPQKLFEQARAAQQSGDTNLAVQKYQELVRLYPEMVAARANLAVALASLGRFDDAIEQYEAALTEAPGDPALRLDLGLAYYKKSDFAGAAAQFALIHVSKPDDVRVATLLGNCEVQLGLINQALALLTPLEKRNADNLDLEWALGTALIRAGKTLDGLERVQKVADRSNNIEAYQLAADLYLGLTYFDKARQDAEAVIRLNSKVAKAYVVLGLVDDYAGDPARAAVEYRKALEIDPKDPQALLQLANALYIQRKLGDARNQIDRLLSIDPKSSPARYELSRIERAQGELPAALKDLQTVEQQDPQWLLPHVDLTALYYRMNRPEDGAREKKIVDQLRAEERTRRDENHVISPQVRAQ